MTRVFSNALVDTFDATSDVHQILSQVLEVFAEIRGASLPQIFDKSQLFDRVSSFDLATLLQGYRLQWLSRQLYKVMALWT